MNNLGVNEKEDIRQFNYYGNVAELDDDEDVEKLEREIDEVMKGVAKGEQDKNNLVIDNNNNN